jgi:hypothetical protein
MRTIKPSLTSELKVHCGTKPIWRASAFPISNFKVLVQHVARLAYLNRDELLFFRGQDKDYQTKAGGTTLYPSVYREDALAARELRHRFELLEQAGRLLAMKFKKAKIDGHRELSHKRYVQWSILQHYEVLATPLLDITQSLRVACSFAQLKSTDSECYVYVLGLPYITNRISINSEHDLVNVRLLSICPPAALRPYFQEGYVAGTADITTDFESKTELDFRNRLIAKFAIPSVQNFWGTGFDQIPETALFPKRDEILELCDQLKSELKDELRTGDVGAFIRDWAALETYLLENARRITKRNLSVREAIWALTKDKILPVTLAQQLDSLRSFRNTLVHQPDRVQGNDLGLSLSQLRAISQGLKGLRFPHKVQP